MSIYSVALKTIVRKEITRFLRIWIQTLLPSVIRMALYFLIFGNFIGSRIKIQGFNYVDFIAPGLIMMAVITNSYSNVVSSFFSTKFQKNVEELLVSPTPSWVIICGYSCGGILRGLLVGFMVSLVSLFFTRLAVFSVLIIFVYVVFTAIVFSLAGLLNAIFAKKFDDISIVPTFVLTPHTYLGGVFYSVAALPKIWQYVSMANPILYMIAGFRYGFLGISDINIWFGLGMLIVFAVSLFTINLYLIKKGTGLRS